MRCDDRVVYESRHCLSVFILFVWIILARLSTLVLIFLTICVVGLLQILNASAIHQRIKFQRALIIAYHLCRLPFGISVILIYECDFFLFDFDLMCASLIAILLDVLDLFDDIGTTCTDIAATYGATCATTASNVNTCIDRN